MSMGNKLREIFCVSDEEILERRRKAREACLARRKGIRLVESETQKPGPTLYRAEPFRSFIGDCEYCDHFARMPAFVEGGDCAKHGMRGCGWGFTCGDNTSVENESWEEFQRIKKED